MARLRYHDLHKLQGQTPQERLYNATEAYMTPQEKKKYKQIVERSVNKNGTSK